MEMAQELNFTKEELEAYKDKLARTKDIRDSLIKAANSKSPTGSYIIRLNVSRLNVFVHFFFVQSYLNSSTTTTTLLSSYPLITYFNTIASEKLLYNILIYLNCLNS